MCDEIKTDRFIIFKHEITSPKAVGGMPRSVFHAWCHSEDIPRPVCVITVNECFANYVEWIHVEEGQRRRGIATEVLRAIEQSIGQLTIDGVTAEGVAFCDAYEEKYPSPVE